MVSDAPHKGQAPEALRTHFEALASDPSFKLSRSRRGTYVNPAVARDWKWFQLGASRAQQPAPAGAPVWQGKWAWVPVEPSAAMLIAGNHGQTGDFSALKVWHDMLGALERSFDYTRPVDPPSTTPAAQTDSVPAQCPYSIDADPQGIRAMVADAITGALAFGSQGANPPPAGHWLAPFWNAARADRSQADSQPASPTDYPALPEPSATGLGDEYEAFDRTGRAMGKAYETILYFKADQMRAYVDADREARKQGGV